MDASIAELSKESACFMLKHGAHFDAVAVQPFQGPWGDFFLIEVELTNCCHQAPKDDVVTERAAKVFDQRFGRGQWAWRKRYAYTDPMEASH